MEPTDLARSGSDELLFLVRELRYSDWSGSRVIQSGAWFRHVPARSSQLASCPSDRLERPFHSIEQAASCPLVC
jgi:hypothetical protein